MNKQRYFKYWEKEDKEWITITGRNGGKNEADKE